jgi:hypothetical protein
MILPLCSIDRVVFLMEENCICCGIETGSLYVIYMNLNLQTMRIIEE